MKNIRVVQADLAMAIGDRESMMVCQLHFWSSKSKIGEVENGVKYIRNTYDGWLSEENFPFWSKNTVRRIFDKLVKLGVVWTKKTRDKWDRTKCYALNYYHEFIKPHFDVPYSTLRSAQNGHLPSAQNGQLNNTYSTPEKTTEKTYRKPPVSFSSKPTSTTRPTVLASEGLDRRPNPCVASYREQYDEASKWIEEQSEDFRQQVKEYCEYHCNGPTVNYPMAVKKKIMVEIWKKQNGMDNHTDFHYINKEVLRQVEAVEIECRREEKVDGFEEEMMRLYQTGELYEPIIE